jgi:hypothetical protein
LGDVHTFILQATVTPATASSNWTDPNENTNNDVVFSFWSVLWLLLGNDKNEVFSFLVRSGPVTGRDASLLL